MRQSIRMLMRGLAASFLFIASGAASAQDIPEPQVDNAREFLDLLELSDDGLETLSAKIQYAKTKVLEGDRQIRRGKLYFNNAPVAGGGGRAFVIDFDQRIINRRLESDEQRWIFDGQWLVEERPAERQFIKRRISAPGENFDPLRIGEGPMPIPIGQKADDILERYQATLLPAEEGLAEDERLRTEVSGLTQLKLIPHEKFREDEDLQEIRLWYEWRQPAEGENREARFMPRFARTINRAGDEAHVQLIAIHVNEPIDADVFSTDAPSEEDGWEVQVIDKLAEAE